MKRIGLWGLLFIAGLSAPLGAQPPSAQEHLDRLDRNTDGVITREEWNENPKMFQLIDRDGSDSISLDEIKALIALLAGRDEALPGSIAIERDIEYGTGDGIALKLDLLRRKDAPASASLPLIVFVHGGGWRAGSKADGIRHLIPLVERGYVGATISYRLSDVAPFPAQIEDCKAAIRFLRANAAAYGVDPERIGVYGGSAGGHLVALLGTSGGIEALEGEGGTPKASSRVQAVCDWFGLHDFLTAAETEAGQRDLQSPQSLINQFLGGPLAQRRDLARQASPVHYITPDDPPFLILHGTADTVVPYSQSVELNDALHAAGVPSRLITLDGAGHGTSEFFEPAVTQSVIEFFDATLGRHPATAAP